jgi:isocitrate lyase
VLQGRAAHLEGFFRVRCGMEAGIARGLACAPPT